MLGGNDIVRKTETELVRNVGVRCSSCFALFEREYVRVRSSPFKLSRC
jgi:hypothetical protein